ncbi:hypothetical protein QP185_17325 [Sphingomonas aerolata]|uniref:hypothetical protein n=1 Tax=Sphingomonas aerolata TaxID=185951 RepID=UPI002FE4216A
MSLWLKAGVALLLLVASQFHFWNRLSSGSIFAPEFPRGVVILFNWAFAAIVLLAMLQLLLDIGTLATAILRRSTTAAPDGLRYAIAGLAALISAIGVSNALRVPPVKDVAVTIAGLPPRFEGYRILQLTDLHISRLFPARWAEAVVTRANAAGTDLIVVTGDFIDGSVAMRRADVAPLRALRAPTASMRSRAITNISSITPPGCGTSTGSASACFRTATPCCPAAMRSWCLQGSPTSPPLGRPARSRSRRRVARRARGCAGTAARSPAAQCAQRRSARRRASAVGAYAWRRRARL